MGDQTAILDLNLPGGACSIRIGAGLLEHLGPRLRDLTPATRALLVTDDTVGPLYADRAIRSLAAAGIRAGRCTVPAGDASKSLDRAAGLYARLAAARHGRDEPVLALGGGMVGDLAGFVAATWMRGVPFVQCPTTLEADIDASIGGKTAINLPAGKNLVGAFHQPLLVCIDIDCLKSLPERDFRAGLAESVKHAIIREAAFLSWHEEHADAIARREPAIVRELIHRNCRIKTEVVMEDERETATAGVGRAALNFGHTVGHALEAASGYALRHGEAVALGMVAALDLAVRLGLLPGRDRDRAERLMAALGLPIRAPRPLDAADLLDRMAADKKARHQALRFVLPDRLGHVRWLESPDERELRQALDRLTAAPPSSEACASA